LVPPPPNQLCTGVASPPNNPDVFWASLDKFKDGFTVVVRYYGSYPPSRVALYNESYTSSCVSGRRVVGVQQVGQKWLWDYDSFCYDRDVWEQEGSGTERFFVISVAKPIVLYQIFTTGSTQWRPWIRSYPNVVPPEGPPDLVKRPMTAFQYVRADGVTYWVAVIPFTWPRPFFYVDNPTCICNSNNPPCETT